MSANSDVADVCFHRVQSYIVGMVDFQSVLYFLAVRLVSVGLDTFITPANLCWSKCRRFPELTVHLDFCAFVM